MLTAHIATGIVIFGLAIAPSATIPAKLQAALFKKIFHYDSKLKGKVKGLKILVVGNGSAFVSAFKARGFQATGVSVEEVSGLGSYDVVYFMPGVSPHAFSRELKSKKVLSLSGDPNQARSGAVSISLGIKSNNKPLIIINLKRSMSEGHEFSSQLLALAEVVK